MNYILGSGIIGLLAKLLLGGDWRVIPFYRSRFFSFNPPLDDNFIIRDERLDDFICDLMGWPSAKISIYKRCWSIGGQLVRSFNKDLCNDWLHKIFGAQVPSQSEVYMTGRMDLPVYDLRINEVYRRLVNERLDELRAESARGQVTEIGDHYLVRGGVREDFEHVVSTIPLDVLYRLMRVKGQELRAKTIHYLHIQTDSLDFEGHNQVLVIDPLFSFYKVTNIAPDRYLFYCHEDIPNPGIYFMAFMSRFDILDGTSIDNALPLGEMPRLDWLEQRGIFPVGSFAQWDWCMDVGSCIIRLLRYAQRCYRPAGMRDVKLI